MKILITGATGFIGKNVLKQLILTYGAHNIIALSSGNLEDVRTISARNYEFSEGYLVENGCEDVEVLIHIGAFIPKSIEDANDIDLTTQNIGNTKRLIQAELPSLRRIVFISTLDVYAHNGGILSERASTVPETLYGWSKLYCEQIICNHCIQNDITYEILRLGHVYGEGEEKYRKVMPVMIRNAIEGKDLTVYGDGKAVRTFIYIDDVSKAIVKAINLKSSEIINVVGDEQITINYLAEMIRSFSDCNISINHVDTNATNVDYIFDNSKLRDLLLDSLTPLKEGLRREYDYTRNKIQNEYNI